MCDVAIPNKEIAFVYEKEILNKTNQNGVAVSIQQAIFSGDTDKLQSLLENYMIGSISAIDGANESFYHVHFKIFLQYIKLALHFYKRRAVFMYSLVAITLPCYPHKRQRKCFRLYQCCMRGSHLEVVIICKLQSYYVIIDRNALCRTAIMQRGEGSPHIVFLKY